ncbi:MAG TPA: ABC transporter permease [Bryobacteraceae bacterium]|jgi:putative ABC transport system permease protein|nr:ABC transporter permease [Bryobacteraceae bacterium]
MRSLWQDFRYAARTLRRDPAFTAIAVAVLAIGIGANSAIFSLFDAVVLEAPPFRNPDELVKLWEYPPGYAYNSVAPLNYLDWSEQNTVFSAMAAVSGGSRTLRTTGGGAERIPGQSVTPSFFDLFGVRPVAGRTFGAQDAQKDARVVVLSERLWRNRFGADPQLVGRTIPLDGEPFTVIGIVPARFQVLYKADLWTPWVPSRTPEQRRMHYLQVFGRLKRSVTVEQARANMAQIAENIARIAPDTNKGWGVTVEPLRQALVGRDLRTTSLMLAAVAGFVLLMACANIANLQLARGVGRTREIAVRASLGGSPVRILRQLLTESVLLSAIGGAAGLLLAQAVLSAAPGWLPEGTLPVSMTLDFNARIAAFAVAAAAVTGLLCGIAPAWQASRISLTEALRAAGRGFTGAGGRLRSGLAIVEIAVAVMLVTGAGLLLRTVVALDNVDPGYHADRVLTMYTNLPLTRYKTPERALQFYQAAEREISSLPGVRSVGMGYSLPMDGWEIGQSFSVVGAPQVATAEEPAAHYQIVNAKYFDTLGIPLLRGRAFTEHDDGRAAPVCIVNEELARRYLKGRDPVGAHISVEAMTLGGPLPVVREVVGVVHQVKISGPAEKNEMEIYVPITQNPWFRASIAVRTAGDPLALTPAVKAAIARVDKEQAVTNFRTMDEVAAESTAQPRFRAQLVGSFGALAMVLAAIGVFGVLAFSVSQRTREFGIRMALGARAGDVLRIVAGDGLRIAVIGIALGLAGAAALTRSLTALLYGVKPADPVTFATAPVVLAVVVLAACAAPAWRASRVDPAVTLRQE